MKQTIIIDHEQYGVRSEFTSINDAQKSVRDCGQEFAETSLTIRGGYVYNERDERVGEVSNA